MSTFFIAIYNFFEKHRVWLYVSMLASFVAIILVCSTIRMNQSLTAFIPNIDKSNNMGKVFGNLKIKDKMFVLFSAGENGELNVQQAASEAQLLRDSLMAEFGQTTIDDILLSIDETDLVSGVSEFVYSHLPLFADSADYAYFDSVCQPDAIAQRMKANRSNLLSMAGIVSRNFILNDPLGFGNNALLKLQDFNVDDTYSLVDGYIFSPDSSAMMMLITPRNGMESIGDNEKLVTRIEQLIAQRNAAQNNVRIEYFGGAAISVYNARQIERDTALTLTIALVVIVVFILLMFRKKRSVLLIIVPAIFGCLFSLAFIALWQGEISAMAVGAGSIVFGIALSYSIHMLAHQNHVADVRQLINEITYPLTVGGFTTIGAFFSLVFTNSQLLRDFGLFASVALIGTTLFCLIFLPHFLVGQIDVKKGRVLNFVERVNAYQCEKNKWLVGGLLLLTIVCLFKCNNVGFNGDMMTMYYEPDHLAQAKQKIMGTEEDTVSSVMVVSVGSNIDDAIESYKLTNSELRKLDNQHLIKLNGQAERFVLSSTEQRNRINRWNNYWTAERRAALHSNIEKAAVECGFKLTSFNRFFAWFDSECKPYDYEAGENALFDEMLSSWHSQGDSIHMLISQIKIENQYKDSVYAQLESTNRNVVVFDRRYFTNKCVQTINDDFNWILYVSAFLIFAALYFSFGRLELALLSFTPMFLSWIIILGLMAILGIEFNIINIILSTFIFGIGDDFSIFIMDGLINKNRTGQQILNSHKTAIFCSTFTIIVGIGILVIAQHPALQSISVISIIGMLSVVFVGYTIEPLIFNFFIANPASKGLPPYTLSSLLRMVIFFGLFFIGCVLISVVMLLLLVVPVKRTVKQRVICYLLHITCKLIMSIASAIFFKRTILNPTAEKFEKPALVIANHQSFIDILLGLSLSPRILMVVKDWVWNSPIFGPLVRYAGFFYVGDGYDFNLDAVRKKVDEGYSIFVFPEGSRSVDGQLHRFHKGAAYLATQLQMDVVPVVIYGAHDAIAKNQSFNLRRAALVVSVEKRITPTDAMYGETYQQQTKNTAAIIRNRLNELNVQFGNTQNIAFYDNLIHNFIYKGPVEEWYLRVKVRMEHCYQQFDEIIPREGKIVDIGCGYGPLCYMLAQTSPQRQILGIDYDEDKIAVAQNGWLRKRLNLEFVCADAVKYNIGQANVFIMNDMLHYMSSQKQRELILRCAEMLLPGGKIIIRDGNTSGNKHKVTKLTEFFSTKLLAFNKTQEELCFFDNKFIEQIANELGMKVDEHKNDQYTSNTIYILSK